MGIDSAWVRQMIGQGFDVTASRADKMQALRRLSGRNGVRLVIRTRDKVWHHKVIETARKNNFQPTVLQRDSQGPTPDKTMGNHDATRPGAPGNARTSQNTAKPKLT
jgi:hypothetical protein